MNLQILQFVKSIPDWVNAVIKSMQEYVMQVFYFLT